MDSLTQFTLGAVLGEACLGRRAGALPALIGGLVATLPDLDSFIPYGDAVASFTYHRSFSHSLLVLSLLAPLAAWGLLRLLRPPPELRTRWVLLVFLALLTHPLLDAFTVYGTQLFWPFSDWPVSGSSIFIVDPVYTLPLLFGLLIALLTRRRARLRRWANLTGLSLSTLYLLWTVPTRFQVEEAAERWLTRQGVEVHRLLATPALNTLLWRVVAMVDGGYYELWYPLADSGGIEASFYADDKSLLEGLEEHWPVARLRRFTHGFYAVHAEQGEILMADLRMGMAPNYIFTFRVADQTPYAPYPRQAQIRPQSWQPEQLSEVWRRLRDSL